MDALNPSRLSNAPRPRVHATLLLLLGVTVCSARAQDADDDSEFLPPIATSGNVEIEDITIYRRRAARQAKMADLVNMRLSLWLTSEEEPAERVLVRLSELDPIHDDTGKLLTTPKRLEALPFLKKDQRGQSFQSYLGKNGPVIHFDLEAPAREATRIKSIKGKALVSAVELVELEFKDLAAINGKTLDHPKLKDFPLKVALEVEDGETELTLTVPPDHARLAWFGLVKNSKKGVQPASEGTSGNELSKGYRGDQTKGTFLKIILAETTHTQELAFEFKDVELP